jgi:hypothetical protein
MESLLALCFGDLDAIDSPTLMKGVPERSLGDFDRWDLVDLMVARFPDIGRPTLRFEIQALTSRCDGDPLRLLDSAAQQHRSSASDWTHRFPTGLFSKHEPSKCEVGFDLADCHLHSGASVPLPVFFSALASTAKPVDRSQLTKKKLISSGGVAWDRRVLISATRWVLWLLRWVRDGGDLKDVRSYVDAGFHEEAVPTVLDGTFWTRVREDGTGPWSPDLFVEKLEPKFIYNGLCDFPSLFWRTWKSKAYEFEGRRSLYLGLVRACIGIASSISARPGDGLSRFVDRFEEMGLTRDAALGDLSSELLAPTLEHVAISDDVVGAEFRKTITAKSRKDFKRKIRGSLNSHHRAFAQFTKSCGRSMALTMPVGFLRRPCNHEIPDWTDLHQLKETCLGVDALRQILDSDDGALAKAIWSIDVAGDEFGSSSWPFAVGAELMNRHGLSLEYAIHAGEAFTSPLNGLRRVGELYLADRYPKRIGHALALSETAAEAICSGGTPPPVRIGDAICDLAWAWGRGCGDAVRARGLISRLVAGPGGQALPADAWREAYEALFKVDKLIEYEVLVVDGVQYSAAKEEDIEVSAARSASKTKRAVAALACGAGPVIAHIDVKDPVPNDLRKALEEFDEEAASDARDLVTDLVRRHSVIEVCPSSNLRLANLGSIENHPVWQWEEEAGIDVVVGSDDPLIFGATIADEFAEMLAIKPEKRVMKIAQAGVDLCGGSHRRRVDDFEGVANRTR